MRNVTVDDSSGGGGLGRGWWSSTSSDTVSQLLNQPSCGGLATAGRVRKWPHLKRRGWGGAQLEATGEGSDGPLAPPLAGLWKLGRGGDDSSHLSDMRREEEEEDFQRLKTIKAFYLLFCLFPGPETDCNTPPPTTHNPHLPACVFSQWETKLV